MPQLQGVGPAYSPGCSPACHVTPLHTKECPDHLPLLLAPLPLPFPLTNPSQQRLAHPCAKTVPHPTALPHTPRTLAPQSPALCEADPPHVFAPYARCRASALPTPCSMCACRQHCFLPLMRVSPPCRCANATLCPAASLAPLLRGFPEHRDLRLSRLSNCTRVLVPIFSVAPPPPPGFPWNA